MISEDYVSVETAKLLKEKGFNANITTYRDDFIQHGNIVISLQECLSKDKVKTPTLQMTMKWLREVHNLLIVIDKGENFYAWQLEDNESGAYIGKVVGECSSYEEACEEAIKYCLENLI